MERQIDYKEAHLRIVGDIFSEKKVRDFLGERYQELERYIRQEPIFQITYEPLEVKANAPPIVKIMAEAAQKAKVGPMAAVAGTISQLVGEFILQEGGGEVIVENGGDIFLQVTQERRVGIYAGPSPLSNQLAFLIQPADTPLGICTSSASVGPSISQGEADAVVAIAASAALADAAATAIANEVEGERGVQKGIQKAREINGLGGTLIIQGETLAGCGWLPELVKG